MCNQLSHAPPVRWPPGGRNKPDKTVHLLLSLANDIHQVIRFGGRSFRTVPSALAPCPEPALQKAVPLPKRWGSTAS